MRWSLIYTVSLVAGVGGCGAGPSTASSVKSPRASQAAAPSLAHRAAKPSPAQKTVARPSAPQNSEKTSAQAREKGSRLSALWSKRRALSCELSMKVQQGTQQGRVQGSIAWVNPSPQDPVGLIATELSGELGGQRCSHRLRSAKDALLMEVWQPKLQLSSMQQLPSAMVPAKISAMRELEVPMVQSLLAQGCGGVFQVPAGQKAMWTLREAGKGRMAWQGPGGASQLLLLDAAGTLPKQRVLEFMDNAGAKVRWTIDLNCKSAG